MNRAGKERAETKRLEQLFANSGGFVLSTSHVIMEDAPVENVVALYETARSFSE